MRFVIYGAGAIGGTIGGRLAQAGHDVVLIARGAHAAAIREHGLRMVTAVASQTVRVPVVEHPRELAITKADVVILAMKSQDTEPALEALTGEPTIVCAQNGVANERAALRRFERVIGMCVMMPVTHQEPGVVEIASTPITGLLDIGRYPHGSDAGVEAIAAALATATFESVARVDIMRWKYKKLLLNLGNALEAATGRIKTPEAQAIAGAARDEARTVFAAAGIAHVSDADDEARRGTKIDAREIAGKPRLGGSSWQSLARGTGSIEADYLNGEIVLLGRLHGIATPVNAMLQRVANQLARDRRPPGSLAVADLA